MAFSINYTQQARRDIFKGIDFYEREASKKIAELFYQSVLNAEKTLKNVDYFEKIYKDFHRLPLKNFPYILIYKIDNKTNSVKIYRVFQTSQDFSKYPEK
ncbi:type II toxin-antitoxin system RelE/ParE family toxin [Halpernia frigidisoli]|uniref:ParE toxin of type II toxin-antitoxin system, parDE n=1 Tax=Halpernia frigidisoli TaxID=1125876 RepID=A0A1I3DGX9_9FLAO|nr:type II toxin-antitoxin system RelE/ParE family toxin [Halpernia frigidisoli]SFH85839.1 ParE toxin of type II toxin-antitoxin system, parDE [Halpernia frigidisoli]